MPTDDVHLTVAPAGDVVAVDLWADGVPDFGPHDAVRVEPQRWWLFDAAADLDRIIDGLGDRGVATAIGGGLVRTVVSGPGWRGLLMVAGLFDAEDPAFGPGACAATIIHHVPVWLVPRDEATCHAYCAASYAGGLVELWQAALARGLA